MSNTVSVLLYRTPPSHRTHHDPTFSLSSATFTFNLSFVRQAFRRRLALHDEAASKFIVGRGHQLERECFARSLRELEAVVNSGPVDCPESVAANLAYALGPLIYERLISVHCEECNKEYMQHNLIKTKWVVDNLDGSGSSGSRLACPSGHYVYADIESVTD